MRERGAAASGCRCPDIGISIFEAVDMSEEAIRKLKLKFILYAMASITIVMFLMVGLIYVANLLLVRGEIGDTMDFIIRKEGELYDAEVIYTAPESDTKSDTEGSLSEQENFKEKLHHVNQNVRQNTYDITHFLGDIFGSGEEGGVELYEEDAYATRYFAVLYNAAGGIESVKANHISSLKVDDAKVLADYAKSRFLTFGKYGQYYYKTGNLDNNRSIVVFLDSTSQINATARVLYSGMLLLIVGFIGTFLLVRVFSGKAIAPEIRNAELQKQFITNASHELKTPLAVIKANTEMQEILGGENEWTQSTLRQVDRLNGLIQNLVLITRAQEKESEERVSVNAAALIRDTVKSYEPVAMQEGKELRTQLPETISLKAVDSEIRQLTTLLVDNAIKYCDPKGSICVLAGQKGRETWLCVTNSYAEGKDVDYTKFFERFYRQDEAHTIRGPQEGRGGYGIGLSIAENLVKKYNGTVKVDWKDGMISFTCTLR